MWSKAFTHCLLSSTTTAAKWMTATLASPESYLNRLSAACAWGVLDRRPPFETVVRPGSGGPRVFDGIVVYRSTTLEGETTELDGIPITTMPRTLLDLACFASNKALARAIRESIRLERHDDARARRLPRPLSAAEGIACDWRAPSLGTRTSHLREHEVALRSAHWRYSATRAGRCPGSTSASPAKRPT